MLKTSNAISEILSRHPEALFKLAGAHKVIATDDA